MSHEPVLPPDPAQQMSGGPVEQPKPRLSRMAVVGLVLVLVLAILGDTWLALHGESKKSGPPRVAAQTVKPVTASPTPANQGLVLDPNHNYGNKYADGLLPVGDGKYVTSGAKTGYVYACSQYAQNLGTSAGGAQSRGPWFTNNNTDYNVNQKIHVGGSVMWTADYHMSVSGGTRTITTNDLPTHVTGTFPILASDPAYAYDRNPNSIEPENLTFALPDDPTYGSPSCMSGEVGVMMTGVVLFSGFDAGGRDAGAWEVQDECSGHPQTDGIYHYHTLSACIKDTSVHDVIGYALDGFPITGPMVGAGNVLTTSDLDACHGITSQITLDGKSVVMYHYVMTQDFPYSISCYRGKPISPLGQSSGSLGGPAGPGGAAPPPPLRP